MRASLHSTRLPCIRAVVKVAWIDFLVLDPTLSTQPDEVMPLVDRSIEPIDRNATIVTSVDRSHFLPRFIDGAEVHHRTSTHGKTEGRTHIGRFDELLGFVRSRQRFAH